jgi:hypothetical protein
VPEVSFDLEIAGIRDVVIAGDPVVVSAAGQLGEPSSSRRVKQEIRDMEATSAGLLKNSGR